MRPIKAWFLLLLALPAIEGCGQAEQAKADGEQSNASVILLPAPPPPFSYPGRPAGPTLDQADIMEASKEEALDRHLRDYFDQTGTALIVASIKSLDGMEIEPFAQGLFRNWGIGDAKTHRGLLIVVAPNERKIRIEVGCGLEAAITNDIARQIIEQDMLPAFKKGDLQGGTFAGVERLEARLKATQARGPTSDNCKKMWKQSA